jgi:hypothetical protein
VFIRRFLALAARRLARACSAHASKCRTLRCRLRNAANMLLRGQTTNFIRTGSKLAIAAV